MEAYILQQIVILYFFYETTNIYVQYFGSMSHNFEQIYTYLISSKYLDFVHILTKNIFVYISLKLADFIHNWSLGVLNDFELL